MVMAHISRNQLNPPAHWYVSRHVRKQMVAVDMDLETAEPSPPLVALHPHSNKRMPSKHALTVFTALKVSSQVYDRNICITHKCEWHDLQLELRH